MDAATPNLSITAIGEPHDWDSGDGATGARRFPPGFLWGAATSAYQIEGAVDEDGRGRSIWDTFSHTPGKVHGGDTGDIACDSYHRYEEDLDLLSELGVGALPLLGRLAARPADRTRPGQPARARLLPGAGRRAARRGASSPWPPLYHWDLPQALEDEGGWANRDTAKRFAEYAELLAARARRPGRHVDHAQRAPGSRPTRATASARTPPARPTTQLAAAATHHLLLGHGLALQRDPRARCRAGRRSASRSTCTRSARSARTRPTPPRSLDAEQNRIFLEPVLHGRYPDAARAELLPPDGADRARRHGADRPRRSTSSASTTTARTTSRLGDWDDLRRGESPLAGHPGRRQLPAAGAAPHDHGLADRAGRPLRHARGRSTARRRGCRCTSPRTAAPPTTTSTRRARSTTSSGSSTCTATSTRRGGRSATASTSPATSSGRCSTTSSGRGATSAGSACTSSTSARSGASRRRAPASTRWSRGRTRFRRRPRTARFRIPRRPARSTPRRRPRRSGRIDFRPITLARSAAPRPYRQRPLECRRTCGRVR